MKRPHTLRVTFDFLTRSQFRLLVRKYKTEAPDVFAFAEGRTVLFCFATEAERDACKQQLADFFERNGARWGAEVKSST